MSYPGSEHPRGALAPPPVGALINLNSANILPSHRHLQPYVFRSPFQSALVSEQKARRARKRDDRIRSNSEFKKDMLGAGVGVVKGVVGTAFGVLGTVVEGGATVANKFDKVRRSEKLRTGGAKRRAKAASCLMTLYTIRHPPPTRRFAPHPALRFAHIRTTASSPPSFLR